MNRQRRTRRETCQIINRFHSILNAIFLVEMRHNLLVFFKNITGILVSNWVCIAWKWLSKTGEKWECNNIPTNPFELALSKCLPITLFEVFTYNFALFCFPFSYVCRVAWLWLKRNCDWTIQLCANDVIRQLSIKQCWTATATTTSSKSTNEHTKHNVYHCWRLACRLDYTIFTYRKFYQQ